MKRSTKIISIVMILIMILSMPICAFAENEPIAKVIGFLNAPSQYTNTPAYGLDADGTLKGKLVSLGNFGGYIVYEMNEPVMNSDKHAYGIDFKVSGNAFNAALTTQEPGQVWVSQDGENWYALAGSEHYEDETIWDYSVTYKPFENRKCTFTDSLGDNGTVAPAGYPTSENYPKAEIPTESLTLSGILLRKQRTASTANGILTSFGYTDTLKNGSKITNPYLENPGNNCTDGQYDISWAVDKNGIGVELDWIKYVKVQTATFIDSGAFGEKSTEVSSISVAPDGETVSKTSAPTSINVDGKPIELSADKDYYEVEVDGDFDVSVNADANVYINNAYGKTRSFDGETEKGIIRVIVQAEDCSPAIYYINTGKGAAKAEVALSEAEKEVEVGEIFDLTATVSNGEKITWSSSDDNIATVDSEGKVTAKAVGEAYITATAESGRFKRCKVTVTALAEPVTATVSFSLSGGDNPIQKYELTVSSDEAEKFGYGIAKKDHNGVKVDSVTVFDVVVAVHEELYGSSFTDNPESYLVMNSSFITKAFGQNAMSSGFLVNGTMPNDGIFNPSYNSYTGYACDTAQVEDGDYISYFFYQDTKFYSDYYSWFSSEEYTANASGKVTVNVNGYCAMYYGINEWETILDKYAEPLEGINVYTYIDNEKVLLGTTDANGNAEIAFDAEGEYVIFAEGETEDESPIIVSYSKVTVSEKHNEDKPHTFIEWIKYIFRTIKNWVVKIINSIKPC